jgi:hypothetical protein
MAAFIAPMAELLSEGAGMVAPLLSEAKSGLAAQGVFDAANAVGKAFPNTPLGRAVAEPVKEPAKKAVGCACRPKRKVGH